jgi:hypothetical protein
LASDVLWQRVLMPMDTDHHLRQLVVVARDEVALYETLRAAFAELPGVNVIRDRRRTPPPAPVLERRRRPRIDAEVRTAGYAVVKVRDDARGQSRPAAAGR